MNKKIGIITIIDNNNYGNRLQNFAVQEVLKKMDMEVLTLPNEEFSNTRKYYLIRKIRYCLKMKATKRPNKRERLFLEFNSKINYGSKKITAYSRGKDYDFFIVGSDQVWNPNISRLREVDVLSFAKPKQRIAFSASFGIDKIPTHMEKYVSKELSKFKAISVREDAGKELVCSLTDREDVEVLLDPTMMLSGGEWDKVAKRPDMLQDEKYILLYFLGGISENKKKEIQKFADMHDCKIIDMLDKNSEFYLTGPSEFLYLEKHAYLICTDSFHSSVFAIIYNRPFLVYDRENAPSKMNSRIDTLMRNLCLDDCRYRGELSDRNLEYNYSHTNRLLVKEQERVYNFLEKAFAE